MALTRDTIIHLSNIPCMTIRRYIQSLTLNEEFYCSNDLNAEENYNNHNKDWPKYYDATLVIPFPPSRGTQDSDTRGFLCIDNFNGGFDPQVGNSILALFATFYYHILEMYRDKTGSYI